VSAAETPRGRGRPYDPAFRRVATRSAAQRGCYIYIPEAELIAAGFSADGPPPFYRTHGFQRSVNAGSVIVSLYRER